MIEIEDPAPDEPIMIHAHDWLDVNGFPNLMPVPDEYVSCVLKTDPSGMVAWLEERKVKVLLPDVAVYEDLPGIGGLVFLPKVKWKPRDK